MLYKLIMMCDFLFFYLLLINIKNIEYVNTKYIRKFILVMI